MFKALKQQKNDPIFFFILAGGWKGLRKNLSLYSVTAVKKERFIL